MNKLTSILVATFFLFTTLTAAQAGYNKKNKRYAGESSIYWSGANFGFRKKKTTKRRYYVRRFGKFRSLRRPHNRLRYGSLLSRR